MTRMALAVGSIAVAAVLTACGGDGDSDGGSGDGEDFADQSGQQIVDASKKAMGELAAVKVSGSISTDGQDVRIEVQTNDQGDCTGSLGAGEGSAELRGVAGDIWFRPDEAFWRASAGDSADQILGVVGDKWVVVPTGDDGFGEFCDIDALLDNLLENDEDDTVTYTKQATEDVDGEETVPVERASKDDEGTSLGYVRVDSPHYLVKVEKTGGDDVGEVTFSEFDEEFEVTAPAEDETIDLDKLAG